MRQWDRLVRKGLGRSRDTPASNPVLNPPVERMRIPLRCHDRLWCNSLAHASEQE